MWYSATNNQLEELGGYLTLKKQLDTKQEAFAGLGYSKILTDRRLEDPLNLGTKIPSGKGPGLKENSTFRIGYVYKPTKLVQFFAEFGQFVSLRQLSTASKLDPRRTANYAEIGLKTDF